MDAEESNDQPELAAETESAAHEDAVDRLPSTGLLSFYDRLRARVVRTIERRGGKLGHRAASALLLVPDVFMLMLRLTIDKEVPKATRAVLASTLAYFVLPLDLMPEGIIGPTGYLDDLLLALSVLTQAFGKDLEPYAERYWNGSQKLRVVMGDVLAAGDTLLGNNLYGRLKTLMAKRGIEIDEPVTSPEGD
ncbi:MAG: DUF1232 domain-containing protein [bacterium]|nr:DUF1232 domain-containing protein [bacterium]